MILSPSHDCRLSDLVHGVIDRLEAARGETLAWSAWAHRDTNNPHAHLVIRYDGRDRRRLEREIEGAAAGACREIRERQREYARELERERNQGPELEL